MDVTRQRRLVQVGMALALLAVGWQYYRWVSHFRHGTPYVPRPAAVEAFLPISALVSLKAWITTGIFPDVHPAGLAIFLALLLSAVFFHRAVCSWICPVGFLEEVLGNLGIRLTDRKFEPPTFLDWPLRAIKYLLLGFFVWVVFVDFSGPQAMAFVASTYNKLAAVKMLDFWLEPGGMTIGVLLVLGVASLLVQNAWCRYLCPYGALLGVIGFLSPASVDVTRDPADCNGCGLCTAACPNYVTVETAETVRSLECTRCSQCLEACPKSALAYSVGPVTMHPRTLGIALLAVVFLVIGGAMLTGHWDTAVTYSEWARLIPAADGVAHAPY